MLINKPMLGLAIPIEEKKLSLLEIQTMPQAVRDFRQILGTVDVAESDDSNIAAVMYSQRKSWHQEFLKIGISDIVRKPI